MAESAEALGLSTLAVWLLREAMRTAPTDAAAIRAFARLCERLERYAPAALAWQQVKRLVPTDQEAAEKIKDLSARDTIVRASLA
jgi:hypothetical protein